MRAYQMGAGPVASSTGDLATGGSCADEVVADAGSREDLWDAAQLRPILRTVILIQRKRGWAIEMSYSFPWPWT
jgi:hypothetical protein